jgi:hypothetical protein
MGDSGADARLAASYRFLAKQAGEPSLNGRIKIYVHID